jgi:hypothetical protein
MRPIFVQLGFVPAIFVLSLLAGCGVDDAIGVPVGAAVAVSSIVIFQRSPLDMLVSAATARDCSVVNLDKGQQYCLPREMAPEPPEFCTRSLGVPDCWKDPENLPSRPREIADGPRSLTKVQDANRRRRWFGLW